MQSELATFVAVVEAGTFSAAARALELPVSTVSRQVSRLEERLGARLLHRSTRRITTTEVGRMFFERCQRLVAEAREAEDAVRQSQGEPRGRLRISAPPTNVSAMHVEELVTAFMQRYPQVEVELDTESRFVDLVAEGYDLALRGGVLRDSSLTARRLFRASTGAVAAPTYLERRGRPLSPAALADHDCIVHRAAGRTGRWPLRPRGSIQVRGRLATNDLNVARHAALAGLGIAFLPLLLVTAELATNQLEHVLPDHIGGDSDGLHAVFAGNRHLPARTRAFLDFATNFFAGAPVRPGPAPPAAR